jgi:hypothetical protein
MKPPNTPSRLIRQADQYRQTETQQRYGQFLQFIQQALTSLGKLSPQQISRALDALTNWLGQDDPLGFLHSLQQGQLFNLLGEVAPVIAQWLSEASGIVGPGGRQSRKGGYARVVRSAGPPAISFSSILSNLPSLATALRATGGSVSINPGPALNQPLSYSPSPNPVGSPNTIDVGGSNPIEGFDPHTFDPESGVMS